MKKVLLIALAAVLAISMAAVGCGGGNGGARQQITLDFATFWPAVDFQTGGEGSPYPGSGHAGWMQAVTDRVEATTPDDETGYTVNWQVFYSKHPVNDLWPGILASPSTYDVITSGPGYTAGVMPLWAGPEYASDLPGRTDALAMTMAVQSLYDDYAPAAAEMDSKVKVMHLWSTGPGYFLMTPDWGAIEAIEDFDGADIRTANPASVALVNAVNASPYYVGMGGAYDAFEAGLVDGILCPTDTPVGFGLDEFLRSAAYAPSAYQFVFMKVMSLATWDSLPSAVQDAIDDVNAVWPEYYGKLRQWGEETGLAYCEDTYGVNWTTVNLPDDYASEYAELTAIGESTREAWYAGNSTLEWMWGNFTEKDAAAAAAYGETFTPAEDPPDPPTSF